MIKAKIKPIEILKHYGKKIIIIFYSDKVPYLGDFGSDGKSLYVWIDNKWRKIPLKNGCKIINHNYLS